MNRHERRKLAALNAKQPPLPQARVDGRPLYYLVAGKDMTCYHCFNNGIIATYQYGQIMMADPANSPTGDDRDIGMVCRHHLPDNAVIWNPEDNTCSNKAGDETWMEDAPDPNFKIKGT